MENFTELLGRGVAEIIQKVSLVNKLSSGKKLVVKLGIDPTSKELHIGHYLVLRKLREFQDAGHTATLVIGDFTAMIGDPSGRDTKRPTLSQEQIKENMEQYKAQAGKIVDLKKAIIVYNSSWFNKIGIDGFLELASKATFAQVMERQEFKERLRREDLTMLQFFYPLLQAYDSVVLKADVEIGGNDQKLNLLMGRQIQKRYGQFEQDLVLTPLLVGLDGKEKMSKTAGNYVGMNETPTEMFAKIMSVPDELMRDYFTYCTRVPTKEIHLLFSNLKSGLFKPIDLKKNLAFAIVETYYGTRQAEEAGKHFEKVFQKGEGTLAVEVVEKPRSILPTNYASLATITGATTSTSEAARLAAQGGLRVDGRLIANPRDLIKEVEGAETLIEVGKRKAVKIIWR